MSVIMGKVDFCFKENTILIDDKRYSADEIESIKINDKSR